MGRKKRLPGEIKQVVGKNVISLMKHHGEAILRMSVKSGISEGTIARARSGEVAIGIDAVQALAEYFGLEPWQLLVPDLDPKHPPAVTFPTVRERELYERFIELAKEIK